MKSIVKLSAFLLAFALGNAFAEDVVTAEDLANAQATLKMFVEKDPNLQGLVDKSAGYAVFPEVGKAGLIIGGSHGKGVLFEGGEPVGALSITSAKIGLVAGVETYSELTLFENAEVLGHVKENKFEFSADATAVAMTAGAATKATFTDGVASFISDQKGLMGDASLSGQKFSFTAK